MCGSSEDPTVYFSNALTMAQKWQAGVNSGAVAVLDLSTDLTLVPDTEPSKALMTAFQGLQSDLPDLHGNTAPFCAVGGLGFFRLVNAQIAAATAAAN